MRTALAFIIFSLIIASGCANSMVMTASDHDLNFHTSTDADNFCAMADMGYTIGYRTEQPNPWSDQPFCLSAKGLFIITETKDGNDIKVSDNHWIESSIQDTIWMARPDRRDPHVALSDRLVNSCPDRSEPLAII
ncbi:hypothetical protein KJ673_02355, partial [Patescibacteria group bacterium]|nr:hypothetical protein [Patescibacteria group bacterium]